MANRSKDSKSLDAIYLMTLCMSLFVVPVTIYRYVDTVSALIALGVISFLIIDFYFRHKMQEHRRKKYLALKKEQREILAEYKANNRK